MTTVEQTVTASAEYNDLTERQRSFVERGVAHARDFATRAAEHDREGTYPFENMQKLHESGYMRMCVPKQFNGEDATLLELCLSQEALAQGCAATALAANMHSFFVGSAAEAFNAGQTEIQMALMMVSQGVTLGGAISEVESADPFRYPAGKVERAPGGFKLNGRKVFGSNTPANPVVVFTGALEENGAKTVYLFQLPKEFPGVTIVEDWDTMGMRGTASYTIEFKDVMAPEALAVMSWPWGGRVAENPFFRMFLCWFAPTIAAVYTGIGVGARNLVRDSLASGKSRLPHGEVRQYPAAQYSMAEMYIEVEASRAMMRRTATRLSDPTWRDLEAIALGEATQQFATSAAVRVVDKAMEISGGGAYFKRAPLERVYRDVRAGRFHPLPHFDALELIGKAELGVPDDQRPRFL